MNKNAKKPGYIPFAGTYVSVRGKEIYEALMSGKTHQECADMFGISVGTASGYAERARKMGIIKPRNKRRVICAVSMMPGSTGQKYEFRGRKAVEAAGFSYSSAYDACYHEREMDGYVWYFK